MRTPERYYCIAELAKRWGFHRKTIRRWFEGEPGILTRGEKDPEYGKIHPDVSLRIPESVALRVYQRHVVKEKD